MTQTKQSYDTIAQAFSTTRQHNWDDIKQMIDIHVRPGQTIADLGCGNGRLISILPKNITYYGLDISPKLIAEATKKHPNYFFQTGNLIALPYSDNFIDIAVAIASFNHIPSDKLRRQSIDEIYRVLKPDGLLIMSNWNLDQPKYHKYFDQNPPLDPGDALIPWKNNQGKILAERFYHNFNLDEISHLLSDFCILDNLQTNHNLITIAQKVVN